MPAHIILIYIFSIFSISLLIFILIFLTIFAITLEYFFMITLKHFRIIKHFLWIITLNHLDKEIKEKIPDSFRKIFTLITLKYFRPPMGSLYKISALICNLRNIFRLTTWHHFPMKFVLAIYMKIFSNDQYDNFFFFHFIFILFI